MNETTLKLDEHFFSESDKIRAEMQPQIAESNFYCRNVKKAPWPSKQGFVYSYPLYESTPPAADPDFVPMPDLPGASNIDNFGITVRQAQLKKAAVHSPDICLDDLKYDWQREDIQKNTTRVMTENAKWVWANAFQNDTLEACENRIVVSAITPSLVNELLAKMESHGAKKSDFQIVGAGVVQHPPRVNFWGKRVYPYSSKTQTKGSMWIVNPKYKKAAEQKILWHPDIVEFLFPDVQNWIGELMWRNILDSEFNPEGTTGFYRMLFMYGAKLIRPDLGTVITVLPPGLKGWLWYWAWKLVGFKP